MIKKYNYTIQEMPGITKYGWGVYWYELMFILLKAKIKGYKVVHTKKEME